MKKTGKLRTFANNAYAVKTVWSISKSRVIHTALDTIVGYVEWIFMSIFFTRYVIHVIETEVPFEKILVFIGLCFVGFSLIAMYNSYKSSVVVPFTDNKIYRVLYKKLYAKARNVELRCFEDADFYNKYTMALDNSAQKMTKSVDFFFQVLFGVGAAAVAFSSMFMIDPFSVLFVISPIIGNFVFGGLMNKIWGGRYVDNVKNNRKAEYVNRVMHLAEFAKEIRYSNIHDLMMNRYKEAIKGNQEVADKYAGKAIVYSWAQNVTTFALVFEGIMIYAVYRTIVSKTMGLAELAIMFTAMSTSSWILIGIFNNLMEAMKNGEFLEYFRTFMEYEEKIPENQEGIMPETKVHSIEFKEVSFAYKEEEKVIENLSFKIEGDKVCAFVGHNGAGKSTIIKLLFRLYDPTEGEILVNGINIKEYNLKAYRRLFSAAFQDYKVMAMSIKDNVLMGETFENPKEVAEHALTCAGVWEKVKSLPNGMDTIMTKEFDKEGVVLSGGEQQKVVVARAFAKKASVKVFDEPSSALDPIAEYALYKGIMDESKGHITIFISHRLSSVKDADMVFMLENGKVIEQGSHKELMEMSGKYCEMFTKQAQNYLADESYGKEAAV
ncbi:MAG: ABC transporter ATP-binding protein [Lachnospiraceae bacterium]|nr:ABC transporter ATP-binding protein [Lachnospiraceae bacterium]MBQ7780818.1 ABC transporter ATP-binding protein [Lachnospiraceae bacterium]